MLRILFLLSLIIISNNAQAKNPINDCFANSETDSHISVCLSIENVKIDNIRVMIAEELIDIVKTKPYIIPGYLKEKTKPEPEPSFKSPSGKRVKSSSGPLEKALKQQAIRDNVAREQKIVLDMRRHTGKMNELAKMHIESTQIFEQYRELECRRLKEHFVNPDAPLLAEYKYKICLYDMTKQRIQSLQKSIEK